MAYDYASVRPSLFLEENQALFLKIRDQAARLLSEHEHATLDQLICGESDTWLAMACVDRMVEMGDLRLVARGEITQYNLYIGRWSSARG